MCRPDRGIRWWMSATRPATEFSIGIIAERRAAGAHRREGVLEGRARQRLVVRIGLACRRCAELAPGSPWNAIFACCMASVSVGGQLVTRQRARLSKIAPACRRRAARWSTSATSMRMPASSARNCSSLSRCSSGDGGSATKRSSAARR